MKFTFIADLHYYSPTLGTAGSAYEMRSGSDQKCLAETGAIIDAAFEKIANSDTDAVMIAGDVTNDGETASHNELREKLYRLKEKKPVYLVTATHDWCCDGNPRKFSGAEVSNNVETLPPQKLSEFYFDFGLSQAIAKYETHLGIFSYVVQLSENVRLLALCDDQNGKGRAGYTEEHFQWIERQIKLAAEDNCLMIGMQHHLLIPHINSLLTGGCCVGDREETAARLADSGLKYMFVGHSHIQRTDEFKSPSGNVLTEVNIGSLCGYPAPIVEVTVQDDMRLKVDVEHLETFEWQGNSVNAENYLKRHACRMIERVLECGSADDFEARMTALQADGRKLRPLYPLIKPVMNVIKDDSVEELYKKMRLLGLAHFLDKGAVKACRGYRVLDIIEDVMLGALDGSATKYSRSSDFYRLVMSFVSIPSKILKNNFDMKKLIFAVDEILTGGRIDNQHAVL